MLRGEGGEHRPTLGAIDITLYRDDVFLGLPKPVIGLGGYALILPVLLLVPKRLTATSDGEAPAT
jgi:hypothetical protein